MSAPASLLDCLAAADAAALTALGEEARARAEQLARADARQLAAFALELRAAAVAVPAFAPWAGWAEGTGEQLRGRPGAAAPLLERAARLFRHAGDEHRAARVDLALVDAETCLGRHRRATRRGRRALAAFRAAGDRAREVSALINLGGIADGRDQVRSARRLWQHAAALVGDDDPRRRAALDGNLAAAALALGHFRSALALYDRAATAFAATGATSTALAARLGAAETRALLGEVGAGLAEAREVEQAARAAEDLGLLLEARQLAARLELELGHHDRAARLAGELVDEATAAGRHDDAARLAAIVAVAVARGGEGDRDLAVEQAFAALRRAGLSVAAAALRVELARSGAGGDHERLGRDAATLERAGLAVPADLARLALARWHAAHGRAAAARALCRSVLGHRQASVWPRLEGHALLAELERDSAPEAAIVHLRRAVALAESLRGRLGAEADRSAFASQVAGCYRQLVELLLARGDGRSRRQALALVARVKSRALVEALDRGAVPRWAGDPELLARWVSLRDELKAMLSVLEARRDPHTRYASAAVASQVRTLAGRLDEVEVELARTDPRLGAVFGRAEDPALAPLLQPGEVFVELYLAGADLVVFDLRRGGLTVSVVPGVVERLEREVEGLGFQLSKAAYGRSLLERPGAVLVAQARSHLATLGEVILGPVWARGVPTTLVVAPHGCLHHVPVAALELGGEPVVCAAPVAVVPSAPVLARILERPHPAPRRFGVAGAGPASLPEIGGELEAVARTVPATATAPASSGEVLRLLADCDAVHLASHGAFQPLAPSGSGLRLADGWLTALDLLAAPLAARFVSVGSCSSGQVAVVPGEELMGFARALLEAGVDTAVLAPGALDDHLARVSAEHLYARLATLGPGGALRSAQLALREEHAHPALWAAFQLYGNPRPWESP